MRIAVVLEATLGGTRRHVVDLLHYLHDRGDEVTFVFSTQRADEKFFEELDNLKRKGIYCVKLGMSQSIVSPLNIYWVARLSAVFRKRRVEVLHLHAAVAGALGRMAARFNPRIRRVIYSPHGGVMHKLGETFSGKLYGGIERMLYEKRVQYIAVSTEEKEKLIRYLYLPEEKISLIPNGIDISPKPEPDEEMLVRISQIRSELGLGPKTKVLLYPALFLPAKGHLEFFTLILQKELCISPDVRILLAGDGPLQEKTKEIVNKLPFSQQILFLGFVKDMDIYFQIADAVLLPSQNEAFGYVLLEAMLHGKLIFATQVGGIPDIVENRKNGFLYPLSEIPDMINDINDWAIGRLPVPEYATVNNILLKNKYDINRTISKTVELYTNSAC